MTLPSITGAKRTEPNADYPLLSNSELHSTPPVSHFFLVCCPDTIPPSYDHVFWHIASYTGTITRSVLLVPYQVSN